MLTSACLTLPNPTVLHIDLLSSNSNAHSNTLLATALSSEEAFKCAPFFLLYFASSQLQMSPCWWIYAGEIWFHFYSHPSPFSPMTPKNLSFRQTWRSNKSWLKIVLQHARHDPEQLDFVFWLFFRCHDTRNVYYSGCYCLFNMYPFNAIKKQNIKYDDFSSGCCRWAFSSCFSHFWPTNVECWTERAWFEKTAMQIRHQKLDFVSVKQRVGGLMRWQMIRG